MTKFNTIIIPTTAIFAAALTSCENPADKTTEADVKDAVDVEEPSTDDAASMTRYVISTDSTISFVGSKVTGSHDGGFKTFTGHFTTDENHEVNGGQIMIDMSTTWADDDKLTKHLKSEDFFYIEEHPESHFTVTSVEKKDGNNYAISGNLKLRGVEKNITFPATATTTDDGVKIDAEFDIDRTDWGIVYKGKADDLIRPEVVIKFDLTASPAEDAAADMSS